MLLRFIQWILLIAGVVCLGVYGYFVYEAHVHQAELQKMLYQPEPNKPPPPQPPPLKEGDLFGRLEIPRLNLSVMVMEGVSDQILRLGAGHIPGTPLAIAAHRDTFFRPLSKIQKDDEIRFTSLAGVSEYRVISTAIVGPLDTFVLNTTNEMMTLVTCYPFYYIGPAPKRFIVQALKIR